MEWGRFKKYGRLFTTRPPQQACSIYSRPRKVEEVCALGVGRASIRALSLCVYQCGQKDVSESIDA